MNRFIREADMLRPIVDNASHFLPQGDRWEHFYEIQSSKGVVDIVFAIFNRFALDKRKAWGVHPVLERASLDVLVAMSRAQRSFSFTTTALAEETLYSASHLRRRLLPSLVDLGWVDRVNEREWVCKYRYKSPVVSVTAVEVKRSEWQRGLMQAAAYTDFADRTYLALDAARVPKDREPLCRSLRHASVGLIAVSSVPRDQGVLSVQLKAPETSRYGNEKFVVAERIAAIRESGGNSGVWGHVFGRMVSTSSGEDPRNTAT